MRSSLILPIVLLALGRPPSADSTHIVARFDPELHRLEASAGVTLRPAATGEAIFEIARSLRVQEVTRDGKRVAFEVAASESDPSISRVTVRPGAPGGGARRYTLRYEGEIHDPPKVAQFSRERIADQTKGTIQPEGIFLVPESGWYPRASRAPQTFRLEVHLPAGWDAVAEGSLKVREQEPSGVRIAYEASHPTEGLHLVAGPFRRFEEDHGGVKIAVHVYPDDADLAESYLAGIRRYLDMYSGWLGPYPYDRFAVVENFFSTGYGMPGFTVLGQEVMRLPFIVDTSLGHEVAHSWWGNGVFVDETGGNWSEGLTTYVADYHYKRRNGPDAAAEYRREACRDYTNYVSGAGSDFPLSEFTERTTAASRAVGYGKAMMLFHMMESRIGRKRFDLALRRVVRESLYQKVSWDTWRGIFSKEAGEDLGWFFEQWVRRPGAPVLDLGEFSVKESGGKSGEFEVSGTLLQKGGVWRLSVPLVFEGEGHVERRMVEARDEATPILVRLPFRPAALRVDPDQDNFRRLDPREMPPVLSGVLGDPKALLVVDDTVDEALFAAYGELAATLAQSGMGEVVEASRLSPSTLQGRNVLLLGKSGAGSLQGLLTDLPSEVGIDGRGFAVNGARHEEPGASLLVVARAPGDPSRVVALFHGLSAEAVKAAAPKLVHYGKYSYLAFVEGKNVAKGIAAVDAGPLVLRF